MNKSSPQSPGGAHPSARNSGDASPARTSSPANGHLETATNAGHRMVRALGPSRVEVIPSRVCERDVFVYKPVDGLRRSALPSVTRLMPDTTSSPKRKRWQHVQKRNRRFVE